MSTKTLSFNTVIPQITSTTKSAGFSTRQVKRSRKFSFSLGSNWIAPTSLVLTIAVAFALGFYVYMINSYASKGYDLKRQQAAMEESLESNKRLVIQQAALGSIVKVNDVASTSGMVPVTGEEFLVASHISSR